MPDYIHDLHEHSDLSCCLFFTIFPFKKAVPSIKPPSPFGLPERFPLSHHTYFRVCIAQCVLPMHCSDLSSCIQMRIWNEIKHTIFYQNTSTLNTSEKKTQFYQDRALTDFLDKEVFYLHLLNSIDGVLITADENLRFITYHH